MGAPVTPEPGGAVTGFMPVVPDPIEGMTGTPKPARHPFKLKTTANDMLFYYYILL